MMSGISVHSICELHNRIRRDPAPATSNESSRLVTRDFPEPPEFVANGHPAMAYTKGLCIPWSESHNAMNYMRMVGPEGREP